MTDVVCLLQGSAGLRVRLPRPGLGRRRRLGRQHRSLAGRGRGARRVRRPRRRRPSRRGCRRSAASRRASTSGSPSTPSRPTGTCVVLVSPDGERSMVPDPGANGEWSLADVPTDLWGPSTHLHVSGYALVNAGARDAALEAVRLARHAGGTVSVDAASSGPVTRVGPSTFLSWIAGVDVVLANADEATVLTGCADPADAALALARPSRVVVVKLGADGALVATRGSDDVDPPPRRQVEVVDTTGAGDAFAAGFLPGWRTGSDLAAALDAGNALGARVVTRQGARPSHAWWPTSSPSDSRDLERCVVNPACRRHISQDHAGRGGRSGASLASRSAGAGKMPPMAKSRRPHRRTTSSSASSTSTSPPRCRARSSSTPTASSTAGRSPTRATASSRCTDGSSTRWPRWACAPTGRT